MTQVPERNVKLVSLLWASPEHIAEIARLHAQLFDPPWDAASVARTLDHPGATALVATVGFPKQLVGFVLGQIAADEAEILSIGVTKDWQGLGLGARLVDSLWRSVAKAGAKRLFLEVAVDNVAAQRLYAKAGFIEVSRRNGYYERKGGAAVDAVVLAKTG